MRARYGANTNPTPMQFSHTYRRILLGITNTIVLNQNILLQDKTDLLAIIPSTQEKAEYIIQQYELKESNSAIEHIEISEYKENVVRHISGYLARKLIKKISCDECKSSLIQTRKDIPSLTNCKEYKKDSLVYPSETLVKITTICEKIICAELESKTKSWMTKKYFLDYLIMKIQANVVNSSLMADFDLHGYDVVKKISTLYCSLRLHHHVKTENEKLKRNRLRNKLTKVVQFKHQ